MKFSAPRADGAFVWIFSLCNFGLTCLLSTPAIATLNATSVPRRCCLVLHDWYQIDRCNPILGLVFTIKMMGNMCEQRWTLTTLKICTTILSDFWNHINKCSCHGYYGVVSYVFEYKFLRQREVELVGLGGNSVVVRFRFVRGSKSALRGILINVNRGV